MITVPHLDFAAIHASRTDGDSWAQASEKFHHGANALRKWYDAQCISRNIEPARPKPQWNPPAAPKPPAMSEDIFLDIHHDRANGKLWEDIAAKHDKERRHIAGQYYYECQRRGIRPVVWEKNHHRKNQGAFKRSVAPDSPLPLPAPIEGGTLYEFLPRGCCQWMLNDAWPWRACGLPQRRGVYCVAHHKDAYHKRREAA